MESMANQFDSRGRLRHLITLKGLPGPLLVELLDRSAAFLTAPGALPARSSALAGRTVANLFFEPSTRTPISWQPFTTERVTVSWLRAAVVSPVCANRP